MGRSSRQAFRSDPVGGVDAVVLQFNFGFFRPAALKRLLERLHGDGMLVFMTLHATMDVDVPGMTARLGDIRTALARVCRLLVHSVHDLNRLKQIGLVENVALFPMGLPQPFTGDRRAVRRSLGLDGKRIVASFGYLLPNKGLPELVRAFALLHTRHPDTHLLMLNALYPIAVSEQERDVCLDEIRRLGVQDSVTLITDFLDEATALARLAASDVVVYPYQHTQEFSERRSENGPRLGYRCRGDTVADLRRRCDGEPYAAGEDASGNSRRPGQPAVRPSAASCSGRAATGLGRRP